MSVINIIIADNHPVVISGIREFLKSASDIRIVATCSDSAQALEKICELQPAVAVLGQSISKINGPMFFYCHTRKTTNQNIVFY